MELIVNGEARTLPEPLTVAELLTGLGMAGRRIALELNGEILPPGRVRQNPAGER